MYYNQYGYYYPQQQSQYFDPSLRMQPQAQQAQVQPQIQQTPAQNGIIWVQGEEGAKAYLVAPGNTIWLMDSEAPVFYIKSTDTSGVPMPLRIFDFSERGGQSRQVEAQAVDYARREDVDKLSAQCAELSERYAALARELGIQPNAEVVHNG